ncbi:MAG: tRNA (guanosine(37)-N1)-methyltransferase TrmD [Gammaproteobacteria bacterium]|nr:tRNA (guanosine(37)-N1)-methyltransferase TrmD [Gammaproteobacteria bacterium]
MHFSIITLFPEMFSALQCGITGRALENGLINLQCFNPRDYTSDNYHKVDDSPYGGGPGMVMLYEPLYLAITAARKDAENPVKTIYLSPQGKKLDHNLIQGLAKESRLILVAGRYEGVDERLLENEIDLQISIGDYVLSGGELPAMVLIDAITRFLPGALGDVNSAQEDSFVDGLLDYPHYTRPETIYGKDVPKVLLSGDHAAINRFRRKAALGKTWVFRKDLLEKCQLTAVDTMLLNEFIDEFNRGKL